jgi:hypothetical protein
VLRETDLVRVVWVSLVTVYRLRAVWVLLAATGVCVAVRCARRHGSWLRGRIARHAAADGAAWVSGYGAGSLEAVELRRGVHLRCLVVGGYGCVRAAVAVVVGDAAGGAGRGLFFVEGEGVDVGAVGGAGFGAVVEDPDDL